MGRIDGMRTAALRLATFDAPTYHALTKGRTSSAKAGKAITWPHKRPSPTEVFGILTSSKNDSFY
jgi:hypothetical protein